MIATATEKIKKYEMKDFPALPPITSDRQNEHYTEALYSLERRGDLTIAEEKFAELLTLLIEAYEEEHYAIADASPIEVLETLMEANNLKQKDLAQLFGSESIVSEVLNGRRELNKHHIEKLSKRFHISPAVFF